MKIRTEDIHPPAQRVYTLDVGGMSQEAVDIFLDEIKRYFKDVELEGDQIIYSIAHLEVLDAWKSEGILDLFVQENLPAKHRNSMQVSLHYGMSYNEVWKMEALTRAILVQAIKLIPEASLNALLPEDTAN